MTDTVEQKALKVLNEVRDERGFKRSVEIQREDMAQEALCRVIYCNEVDQADLTRLQNEYERVCKQHEAYKQWVSDGVVKATHTMAAGKLVEASGILAAFIIPKPDPLVEVISEVRVSPPLRSDQEMADEFRAALAARGLAIREIERDD